MKKILTVVGARPQFIKAATVSRVIAERTDMREILVHTGQHYDAALSDIFFEQMDIPAPGYNLGIGGASHGAMTGRQLEKIEEVLLREKPDGVLVYGDTNSTLAGALAAVKLHIPVMHVEAGLRSFNRHMPEEINRVLTDHMAMLLFAPTETACSNLLAEGLDKTRIHLVGDVMYDAAIFYQQRAMQPGWFDALGIGPGQFILCTIHRAENTDDPQRLRAILAGLAEAGLPVILPLHPRTRQKLSEQDVSVADNIHIADPVGYLEMTWLETNCRVVATDSGGVQKEAYFHAVPCLTLRAETEWVELVSSGWNVLCPPTSKARVADALAARLSVPRPAEHPAFYGDGNSARRIVDLLAVHLMGC